MGADGFQHVQAALTHLEGRLQRAVARAEAAGHDPTDALRGLVITVEEVHAHLSRGPLAGLWAEPHSPDDPQPPAEGSDAGLPLARLARAFNLTPTDRDILLLALAPELDRRYERLFAYLHDDVSQRRPTVNLAMNLLGDDAPARFAVWERLAAAAPLRAHHLIDVLPDPNQREPVFLAHQLKVDQRIVAYLLGSDAPDARLGDAVTSDCRSTACCATGDILAPIRAALPSAPMVYLQGPAGAGRRARAAALCAEVGLPLIGADLSRLQTLSVPFGLAWRLALREARLAEAALLLYGWESCLDEAALPPPDLWAALLAYERVVFLCGVEAWEPHDVTRARRLLRVAMDVPPYAERLRHWEAGIARHVATYSADAGTQRAVPLPDEALAELAAKFRLTPGQITAAVNTAADLAASRAEPIHGADLYAGAQAHSSARLGRLAKRLAPRFVWDDLVLPPDRLAALRELRARARYTHVVHDDWGFGRKVAPGRGVSALFAGESGTGKTMAAEVIANELGLALYKIDLSSVVSKYIGETEKNLSAIFAEATASNAILFFDEADALFGKRSEVKDAHDRYANIEIAYLLQQMEDYDGVAVLATNLRQNLDEAFTRRIDFVIDFPFPDAAHRRRIWAANFPPGAPLAPDADLDELAARFRLAGGNIRNAALASAYLAASDGGVITMAHIRHAIRREHQKMGRLLDDAPEPQPDNGANER